MKMYNQLQLFKNIGEPNWCYDYDFLHAIDTDSFVICSYGRKAKKLKVGDKVLINNNLNTAKCFKFVNKIINAERVFNFNSPMHIVDIIGGKVYTVNVMLIPNSTKYQYIIVPIDSSFINKNLI